MAGWRPLKRRDFIRRLRALGFDGPFSGTRHQFRISASTARPSRPIPNTPCRKSECCFDKSNPSSRVRFLWMNGIPYNLVGDDVRSLKSIWKIEMSLVTSTPTKSESAARPGVYPAHARFHQSHAGTLE
ncbi:MAG TPA: hypothetical protein VIK59_08340 [Verrucomicrobiae bacterium]